jgi:hypothetical protein
VANDFDQFDAPQANDFDQFDAPPVAPSAAPVAPHAVGPITAAMGTPDPVTQYVHSAVSGMGQNIGATNSMLGDLVHGRIGSISQADAAVQQYKATHPAYQPETQGGQDLSAVMASNYNPLNWPGVATKYAGKGITALADQWGVPSQYSTIAGTAGEAAGNVAIGAYGAVKALGLGAPGAAGAPESAAATARGARIEPTLEPGEVRAPYSEVGDAQELPPQSAAIQQAVQQRAAIAQQQGRPLTTAEQTGFARHTEAASLPVPMTAQNGTGLTAGQALGDGQLISDEMNGRSQLPGMPERLNAQNGALVQNLTALKSQAAGPVSIFDSEAHSGALIKAYEAHDAAVSADVTAKYNALTDANGGTFPVDGKTLVGNIDAALTRKLKSGYLPSGMRSALDQFTGPDARPMNFEDYETLRTDAATAMRSGGNEASAAYIVRKELENLPLADGAAGLKPLADAARSAASGQFDAIKADPAYKAVVNGTADTRTFGNNFVTNASREDIQSMMTNLSDQPGINQHLGGIAANWLRDKASISPDGSGNFASASYNKGYNYLNNNGKLNLLVGQPTAEGLGTLGRVARYTTNQPKGSWVSTANTVPAAIREYGAKGAEGFVNYAAHGVPIGTAVRSLWNRNARASQAAESLRPFAGVPQDALMQPPGGLPQQPTWLAK